MSIGLGEPPSIQDAAERHLLTAPIEIVRSFIITSDPGGGHPTKRTLLLSGGQTVVAKCAPPGDLNQLQQAKHEVAAWKLLRLLGWQDLGATTVLRTFEDPVLGMVTAALQTAWPSEMFDAAPAPASLPQDQTFRAAIFDFLILNCDRGGHNWFGLKTDCAVGRLKLFDHGHCFGLHAAQVSSTFVAHHAGQDLPDDCRQALRGLTSDRLAELRGLLETDVIDGMARRCAELLTSVGLPSVAAAA